MTEPKTNQKNYNLWSSYYDSYPNPTVAIDEMSVPEFYQNWSKAKILEIGCGTGRHTVRLNSKGNQVIGIDVSEGMLKKAKEKIPEGEFIHGDFMEQEFEQSSFDKVFMSLVLEHISNLDSFFQKIVNLLNTQGEVLISELHPERGKQGSLAHFTTKSGDEVRLSSKAHSEDEILRATERAGLKLNFKHDIWGNNELVLLNQKWSKYLDKAMIQVWFFSR